MPVFIFPGPGGNPLVSWIVGLAMLAMVVGLIIFFLPVLLGIVLAVCVIVLILWGWNWLRLKMGGESEDVRNFREAMERAEAAARAQYSRSAYSDMHGEARRRSLESDLRRRSMRDVEDAEEV